MTVFLSRPILRKGLLSNSTLAAVEVRGATVQDFIGLNFAVPEKQIESTIIFITRITNLKLAEVHQLHMDDVNKIMNKANELYPEVTK